mmetsp:Transcript_18934/g.24361  ORF Transcript_18934/g.24361 Transcript_18934/m.24361 type:complete len:203 (+) Transcript_18934:57-665(+)
MRKQLVLSLFLSFFFPSAVSGKANVAPNASTLRLARTRDAIHPSPWGYRRNTGDYSEHSGGVDEAKAANGNSEESGAADEEGGGLNGSGSAVGSWATLTIFGTIILGLVYMLSSERIKAEKSVNMLASSSKPRHTLVGVLAKRVQSCDCDSTVASDDMSIGDTSFVSLKVPLERIRTDVTTESVRDGVECQGPIIPSSAFAV